MVKRKAQLVVSDTEEETSSLIKRYKNIVYFHADVSKETVLKLAICLEKASRHVLRFPSSKPDDQWVYLYVHSDGGDAYAGLSAMAHIKSSRVPVHTIVDGFVASAATFMILAGKRRTMQLHARFLVHQIRMGFSGKYEDLLDEVENSNDLTKSILDIYKSVGGITTRHLNGIMKRERHLTANECKELNFIHEIV